MTLKMIALVGIGTAGLLMASLTASRAEPIKIKADLSALQETPPNSSKGTGTLTGTFDPATKVLTYDVSYADLTGPATAAHFHAPAPAGKSSGVEIPIKTSIASPIKGTATLDTDQARNLTDGMTYFNIHTVLNNGGEIRGQVTTLR